MARAATTKVARTEMVRVVCMMARVLDTEIQ